MLASIPDDDLGSVTVPDVVPRLSATPGMLRHSGHRVGQDTRRILGEVAALSSEEITRLEAQRVIVCDKSTGSASTESVRKNV